MYKRQGGYNPYDFGDFSEPAAFAAPLLSDGFSQDTNVVISGLTAGGKYDLYLYSQAGGYNSGGTTFTFGTTKTAVNNAVGDGAFTPGVNYVEFVLTANGSGDIIGSYGYYGGGTSMLNGLQIQAVAAPEPSTYALVALGAGMLMLRLRRKGASLSA